MAAKKGGAPKVRKVQEKPAAVKKAAAAKKAGSEQAVKKAAAPEVPAAPRASARTCPLVLDGILGAKEFSPKACFSCDEFDCRFYEAEGGSGALQSRLFVSEEGDSGDDDDDGFGGFYGDDRADDDGGDDDDSMDFGDL